MYKLFVWEGTAGLPTGDSLFGELNDALDVAKKCAKKYGLRKVRGKLLWYRPTSKLVTGITSLSIIRRA